MGTISDRKIVDEIVSGNGIYPGDENCILGPVIRVVEYTTIEGEIVWGILYKRELTEQGQSWDKYMHESFYVSDPFEYWRHPNIVLFGNRSDSIRNKDTQ